MPRILLIEDDQALGKQLVATLSREGFDTTWWSVGQVPLAEGYDLVVLDLMLPGLDGFSILEALRGRSEVPILVLSAKSDTPSKLEALRLGADDYMTKPFWPAELVLRVKARLRRPHMVTGDAIEVGRLRIDAVDTRADVDGRPVQLTPFEHRLLLALARRPGHAISRDTLNTAVGSDEGGRGLDIQVSRLRKKLGDAALVRTVWGIGYRLEAE